MDRRSFLKGTGASIVTLGFAPRLVWGQAARPKVVVSVFQRGAVDGLNMVVPFAEQTYYDSRPNIAIPMPSREGEGKALDLDGFFAFHPAMAPLKPLFEEERLAVVHAAGSHDPTRSHFDAQDYMESATPGVKSTRDGWMNRYLQSAAGDASPLRGMSIGRSLPRTLAGRSATFSLGSLAEARLNGPARLYRELFQGEREDIVSQASVELFETLDFLEGKRLEDYSPSVDYPNGRFPAAMRDVAQLIKTDAGLETAFVEIGGWDHHANEGGTRGQIANRLREFSGGLRAFYDDLGDRVEDVVVVTMSEFGRTVRENGNRGTDHGHANAMLVLGGPVRGGKVYGKWPGLETEKLHEGRDLAVTTDFRNVLAEVLAEHLGAGDLDGVFPDFEIAKPFGLIQA